LFRFPWRALLLLWQLRIFAAAAARLPTPPRPPYLGEGSIKKPILKEKKQVLGGGIYDLDISRG
jgi:hypothetical protein